MKTASKIAALLLIIATLTASMLMSATPALAAEAEEKEVEAEANPFATDWIPDQKVSQTTQTEYAPSIASDGKDLWVAYMHANTISGWWEIRVAKSTDGGTTWTVMHTKTNSGYSLLYPSIAVDVYLGYVYVVYMRYYSGTDKDIWLERYDGSSWYTEYIDNSANNDQNPTIVCEYDQYSSNNVYIVWERYVSSSDIDLVFANSTTHGDTWTQKSLYSNTVLAHQPSMAYADGYIYVAFRNGNSTNGDILVTRSANGGVSWGTAVIDSYSNDCSQPSVAAAHGGGFVMVAFVYEYSATDDDIRARYSTNYGSTWGSTTIASTLDNERYPHLTVDGMGEYNGYVGYVHATWWRNNTVGTRTNAVYYSKANIGSPNVWSNDYQVADDTAKVAPYTWYVTDRAITTVNENVPVIVWTDGRLDADIRCTTLGGKYTIDTYPSGLQVRVDLFNWYDAPVTLYWALKSEHQLYTSSQGTHSFVRWSDGGNQMHMVTAETLGEALIIAYFTPTLTLNLSPNPVARGSVLTLSGQLTPGKATTVTLYYRTNGVTWAVATYLSTNAAGAYNVGASVPHSLPAGTYDLVAVWWDSSVNRHAISDIKKLVIT